jgi:hypothetical protein
VQPCGRRIITAGFIAKQARQGEHAAAEARSLQKLPAGGDGGTAMTGGINHSSPENAGMPKCWNAQMLEC